MSFSNAKLRFLAEDCKESLATFDMKNLSYDTTAIVLLEFVKSEQGWLLIPRGKPFEQECKQGLVDLVRYYS